MKDSPSNGRTVKLGRAARPVTAALAGAALAVLVAAPAAVGVVAHPVALHSTERVSPKDGPNVCKLIASTTVANFAKESVGKSTDTAEDSVYTYPERHATGNRCTYATPSNASSPTLQVTLYVTNSAAFYAVLQAHDDRNARSVKVPGATEASFDGDYGVDVLWGTRLILVEGAPGESDSPPSPTEDIAIARALMATL